MFLFSWAIRDHANHIPPAQPNHSLLLELQGKLSADLFASATPLRLAADEALFLAGDGGDGCYLVEEGLLKVAVASQSGGERILAFLGPGRRRNGRSSMGDRVQHQ
jgi:Cyclic nucleotide-binding domain